MLLRLFRVIKALSIVIPEISLDTRFIFKMLLRLFRVIKALSIVTVIPEISLDALYKGVARGVLGCP